jgi:DNA invertase Pin-like site-specific DNA recombinase
MSDETKKPVVYAGYVRVSSDTQVRAETHLGQKEALEKWAADKGVGLVLYMDKGVSGVNNLNEPNFQKMMTELTDKKGLVVTAFDRLSRDAIGLMQLTRQLKEMGKELTSLREGDMRITQALDASAQLTRDVFSIFAEYNKEVGNKRLRDGYRRYIAQGGKVGRRPLKLDWAKIDPLIESRVSAAAIARLCGLNLNTARLHVRRRKAVLAESKKSKQAVE